jgi:transcriptional regulator with XRE-family HTH domain
MDEKERRQRLADFLRSRRARISPTQVGLPEDSRRRVQGLRREEVAELANISVTWYTWLEQGRSIRVSSKTILAIALALQLDHHDQEQLFILAGCPPLAVAPSTELVTPSMRQIIDSLNPQPAYIVDRRWDLLAWNQAAGLVFGFDPDSLVEQNLMWFAFTNKAMRQLFRDWEKFAQYLLAHFRADYSHNINDPRAVELAGIMKQTSPEFRKWWKCHEATRPPEFQQELEHPTVGNLLLDSVTFQVYPTANLRMVVYTPVLETDTAQKLQQLLASGCEEDNLNN